MSSLDKMKDDEKYSEWVVADACTERKWTERWITCPKKTH